MKKLLAATLCLLAVSSAFASSAGDPGPWGNTVFVRGGFNGWGTPDPMTWNPADESFTAVIAIDAGNWEFKIADDGWSNPDFGPTGDPVITLGAPSAIGTAIGANFALLIVDPGNYLFTLSDLSAPLDSGTLIVERVVPIPAAGFLLLSALGGLGVLRRRRR